MRGACSGVLMVKNSFDIHGFSIGKLYRPSRALSTSPRHLIPRFPLVPLRHMRPLVPRTKPAIVAARFDGRHFLSTYIRVRPSRSLIQIRPFDLANRRAALSTARCAVNQSSTKSRCLTVPMSVGAVTLAPQTQPARGITIGRSNRCFMRYRMA